VAEWQKISDRFNLLEEYYKKPERWAFTFQINAILSRMKELGRLFELMEKEKDPRKVFFSERSIVADREIFAKLLHQEGKMNSMEHALYLSMYNSLDNLFKTPRVHRFIYLRSSPEKCMERMLKRARHE
jgi:deoxyadenosine/deoxycytidine kinase